MPYLILSLVLTLCSVFTRTNPAAAQNDPSPILFIYDASGSMWGEMDGSTKVEIARNVLSETINGLDQTRPLGLVVYGHREEGNCDDIEYITPLSTSARASITTEINNIKPLGRTPLARSAKLVIEELENTSQNATIILITDGIESCDGDLCEVIQTAKAAGLNFRLHIVGFGIVGEDTNPLQCAAQAGGGQYYDAQDGKALSAMLNEATQQTLESDTDNLAIYASKNNTPIDAWVKVFKANSETEVGGIRTYRDTGYLFIPPGIYDLEIRALENTDIAPQSIIGIQVPKKGLKFQSVNFDAGVIKVQSTMNGDGWDATVNITTLEGKSVGGGRTYGRSQIYDVDPGTYQVNLKGLQIRGTDVDATIENVVVRGLDTTEVQHNFETGTARIGAMGANGLMDATVNIIDQQSNKSVGGSRTYTSESSNPKTYLLTPGNYSVILVGVKEFKGEKRQFEMIIRAGDLFEKMVQF